MKKTTKSFGCWMLGSIIVVLVSAATSGRAVAQWDSLLLLLPEDTNAVVAIDVDGLRSNPLALLPAITDSDLHQGARYVLIGALMDPESMGRAWELGLVHTQNAVNLDALANRIDGYVDEISGYETVRTGTGAYVVKLFETHVAALHPASRQQVASWLRERARASGPSPYLRNAVTAVGRDVHFVASVDLRNTISPSQARRILSQSAYAGEVKGLESNLSALLSNAIGMTFSMRAGRTVEGRFQIDYGFPPKGLEAGGIGVKLLLEAIADRGAYLDEFAEWRSGVVGNSLVLEGSMTLSSARRLLKATRLRFDTNFLVASDQESEGSQSSSARQAEASLIYLRDLTDHLDRLSGYRGSSASHYARWLRRGADVIDELPNAGVDPDLLDFGIEVPAHIRKAANDVRRIRSRRGVKHINNVLRSRYGDWKTDREKTQGGETTAIEEPVLEHLDAISDGLTRIRTTLSQRFGIEF